MWGDKWIESIKNFHVRAGTIGNLKKGDELKVILFDRNFCDYIYNYFTKKGFKNFEDLEKNLYDPKEIITGSANFAVYTHKKDLEGNIKIFAAGDDKSMENPFVFDVEYEKNHFLPVCYIKDANKNRGKNEKLNEDPVHYIKENVRIGWRGPMILQKDLENLPPFFLKYPIEENPKK